jgi:hypothetical protein
MKDHSELKLKAVQSRYNKSQEAKLKAAMEASNVSSLGDFQRKAALDWADRILGGHVQKV